MIDLEGFKMTKKIFAVMIGLGLAAAARADQGTTAASFLKLETGPRAIAMGDSFAGIADDVNAIQYNPGGLGFQKDKDVTVMYVPYLLDITYSYLGVAWPLGGNLGTLALSGLYLNGGSFDKYTLDSSNNPVADGQFTASDMLIALSYSRIIIPSVSVGLNLKMISETIDSSSASSFAADLGALWHTPIKGLSAGIDIQNLGPDLGFQESFTLPVNTRIGVGFKPSDNIAVDCDFDQPIETAGIFSIGGEYGYRDFLFLRMGYKYQGAVDYNEVQTGYGPAVVSGLNFGLGFKVYKNYSFDYAYSNFGFLGTPNYFALSAKFQ
jgi:hypothetical protein